MFVPVRAFLTKACNCFRSVIGRIMRTWCTKAPQSRLSTKFASEDQQDRADIEKNWEWMTRDWETNDDSLLEPREARWEHRTELFQHVVSGTKFRDVTSCKYCSPPDNRNTLVRVDTRETSTTPISIGNVRLLSSLYPTMIHSVLDREIRSSHLGKHSL